jgi:hypothetical protein
MKKISLMKFDRLFEDSKNSKRDRKSKQEIIENDVISCVIININSKKDKRRYKLFLFVSFLVRDSRS